MAVLTHAGRPRGVLPQPRNTLTVRVRQLVDVAHGGKVRDASRLTGIPYPTINDLYTGRSANPNLATLESLRVPYEIDLSWLLSDAEPQQPPRTGIVAFLPPDPRAEVKRRVLREIQIPFVAWSMYEVFSVLESRLGAMKATAERPIVAEASGDALVFRLATFLCQPLLAAEKAGEQDVILVWNEGTSLVNERMARWSSALEALGEMWRASLRGLLRDPKPEESEVVRGS